MVPARDGQVVIGLLIIGTVASNQGSGHCRLLTPRFWTHLETSTTLDPKSTRSADLLDAEYSEDHGNEKNVEKFLKEKCPAGIDTINLNRCDIWFYSSSLMLTPVLFSVCKQVSFIFSS